MAEVIKTSNPALIQTAGNLMIALSGGPPAPDNGTVHIWKGTAGTVDADGESVLVVESSNVTQVTLQMLGPNTSERIVLFGEPASQARGFIGYRGSNNATPDSFRFGIGAAVKLTYAAGAFAFQEATTISTSAGALTLSPTTYVDFTTYIKLQITDTDGAVEGQLWYDASEDKLKFKTAAGVETITSA